jgi:hypothetical protein
MKREPTMSAFRILGCWLFLFLLVTFLGCGGGAGYVRKGPEVKVNTVTINNCVASPDTVQVNINDTLTWVNDPSDQKQYTIHFKRTPLPANDASTGQGQKVKGDFWCNNLHSRCVYPYDLKVGIETCKDPGVHVVPQ